MQRRDHWPVMQREKREGEQQVTKTSLLSKKKRAGEAAQRSGGPMHAWAWAWAWALPSAFELEALPSAFVLEVLPSCDLAAIEIREGESEPDRIPRSTSAMGWVSCLVGGPLDCAVIAQLAGPALLRSGGPRTVVGTMLESWLRSSAAIVEIWTKGASPRDRPTCWPAGIGCTPRLGGRPLLASLSIRAPQ